MDIYFICKTYNTKIKFTHREKIFKKNRKSFINN